MSGRLAPGAGDAAALMGMHGAIRFAVVALLALLAGEALAQFGGNFPGGGQGGRRGGNRGGDTDRSSQSPRPAQPEQRADLFQTTLEELRVDLKLEGAQQRDWNAYVEKLTALMSDVARERSRSGPAPTAAAATAPQQIDRLVAVAQNRATALEDVSVAAKALYAGLRPEQKTVADLRLAHVSSLALGPGDGATSDRRSGIRGSP